MTKYLALPKTLEQCTKEDIRNFIQGTEQVFRLDLFGEGKNRGLDEPYSTFDGKYHWSSNKDFFVYITDLTKTSDIRSASNVLYQTFTGAPEYPVHRTTLSPDELAQLQDADRLRKGKIKEIEEKTRRGLNATIEKKQALAEASRAKATENVPEKKNEVIKKQPAFQPTPQVKRTEAILKPPEFKQYIPSVHPPKVSAVRGQASHWPVNPSKPKPTKLFSPQKVSEVLGNAIKTAIRKQEEVTGKAELQKAELQKAALPGETQGYPNTANVPAQPVQTIPYEQIPVIPSTAGRPQPVKTVPPKKAGITTVEQQFVVEEGLPQPKQPVPEEQPITYIPPVRPIQSVQPIQEEQSMVYGTITQAKGAPSGSKQITKEAPPRNIFEKIRKTFEKATYKQPAPEESEGPPQPVPQGAPEEIQEYPNPTIIQVQPIQPVTYKQVPSTPIASQPVKTVTPETVEKAAENQQFIAEEEELPQPMQPVPEEQPVTHIPPVRPIRSVQPVQPVQYQQVTGIQNIPSAPSVSQTAKTVPPKKAETVIGEQQFVAEEEKPQPVPEEQFKVYGTITQAKGAPSGSKQITEEAPPKNIFEKIRKTFEKATYKKPAPEENKAPPEPTPQEQEMPKIPEEKVPPISPKEEAVEPLQTFVTPVPEQPTVTVSALPTQPVQTTVSQTPAGSTATSKTPPPVSEKPVSEEPGVPTIMVQPPADKTVISSPQPASIAEEEVSLPEKLFGGTVVVTAPPKTSATEVKEIRLEPAAETVKIPLRSKEDRTAFFNVVEAAKNDPHAFEKAVEENITLSVSKNPVVQKSITPALIEKTAQDFTSRVINVGKDLNVMEDIPEEITTSVNPVAYFSALTNTNDPALKNIIPDTKERVAFVGAAKTASDVANTQYQINTTLMKTFLPEKVVAVVYGPEEITQFSIADNQADQGLPAINVSDIRSFSDSVATLTSQVESGEIEPAPAPPKVSTPTGYPEKINNKSAKQTSALLDRVILPEVKTAVLTLEPSVVAVAVAVPDVAPYVTLSGLPAEIAPATETITTAPLLFAQKATSTEGQPKEKTEIPEQLTAREPLVPLGETEEQEPQELTIEKQQNEWASLQQQKLPEVAPKDAQERVVEELKGKVIYAVPEKQPPQIVLSENEQNFVKIAQVNPQLFADKLSKLIIEKNPDIPAETLQPLSQIVAVNTTQSLIDPTKGVVPTGVFAAISKTGEQVSGLSQVTQDEVAKTSVLMTVFSENQDNLYRTLLVRSVGENLTNKVLGFPETVYTLSETPRDGSFELKLDQLQTNSFSLQESPVFEVLNSPSLDLARSGAKSQLSDFATSTLKNLPKEGFQGRISQFISSKNFDSIAPFLGMSTEATYIGTNFFGKAITTLLPNYAPAIANLSARLGLDIGIKAVAPIVTEKAAETGLAITGGATKKVAGGVVGKGLMALATKVGLGSTITAIGQALGSFAPIVGNIIAFIATSLFGKIIEKINWKKVKEWSAAIIGGVAGLIALPFLGLGAALGIGLGTAALSVGLGAGMGGLTLGGIGAGIAGFFGALGGAFLGAVGMPILVTLLTFPVVVALILFVINTGAYVVPPTSLSIGQENPYISVEKTVVRAGPFQNTALPITVEYTIKITAKISPLSNVRLDYKCEVLRKGTKPNCPDIGDSIPGTDKIGTISPSNSYSFKYTMTYSGNSFTDSFVSDTITATVDTPEKLGITTSGSASIIIGKPDVACYKVLTTGQYAVPSQYMAMYNNSIFKIIEDWPAYVAKTCPATGGQVNIGYGGPDPYWGKHLHLAAVDFILYQQPLGTLVRTEFTMIHELGHHIGKVNPVYYAEFKAYPGIKWPICSYSATTETPEAFAETLGLYGSGRSLSDSLGCSGVSGTFKDNYPANWEFANTVMFH